MRLVDADETLHKAWQNFYKQEDEHEKNIDGYDIMRDQFYEQSGFECCQQTIVNAPTVEAIPKADYEARLKAEKIDMLTELKKEIEELDTPPAYQDEDYFLIGTISCSELIQQKINLLKENEDGENKN